MKQRRWMRAALSVAALALVLIFCRVTVVPDEVPVTTTDAEGNEVIAQPLTVAEQYCLDNWESTILPAIDERAIDLSTFAEGLHSDLAALGEAHAARANETSPWNFCLKGQARVTGIESPDAKTKKRLLLDVAPYDGEPDVKVQISSVIKTNAIRDAVGFLKLDNFANQVEFAELTKAFNARIQQDVLSTLDAAALVGQEIDLTGCASVIKAEDEVLIVPVHIALAGG